MTITTDSLKEYAQGLQNDLIKEKERKEKALQIASEADNKIKTIDGALQFAALLAQESEKNDPATEDTEVTEEEAQ